MDIETNFVEKKLEYNDDDDDDDNDGITQLLFECNYPTTTTMTCCFFLHHTLKNDKINMKKKISIDDCCYLEI